MGVGQVQIDREQAPIGEEHHPAPVGAQRRGHVVLAHLALHANQLGAVVVGQLGRRAELVVGLVGRGVPALHQLVGRHVEHAPDRLVDAALATGCAEQLADPFVAEGAADICEERLPVAVREVPRVVELAIRREGVPAGVLHRPAHPHRGQRRRRPDGEVFRHPLDEPEWQRGRARESADPAGAAARHVVLEGVRQLVTDDVVEVAERAADRENDPPSECLGDAAGPFAEAADDVGLLELGRGGVEDQRLTAGELVVQDARVPGVPPLGHPPCNVGRGTLSRIEVDVEVLGAEDMPIEVLVLDLVAPEVLGGCRRGSHGKRERADEERSHRSESEGPAWPTRHYNLPLPLTRYALSRHIDTDRKHLL
jgi:hypothetical protein